MIDKKAEIIHEYEETKNIPVDFRYTEYVESYESYMIKMGLDPEKIEDRYNLALLAKAQQNEDKFQGIMEITLQHNIPDTAEYALKNINAMFDDFLYRDEKVRKIGIKVNGMEPVYLLKIRDTDILPEYISIPENLPNIDYLRNIQHEWFVKTVYVREHKLEEQTKELLNISGSKLSPKQEKYNYARELKRKMKSCHILKDEQMEEFDFRTIPLNDCIFLNCNLKNANFSYVNLESVSFIKDRNDAEQLLSKLKGTNGVVKDYSVSNNKKKAPLLYNLAEIQNDCSKKFKLSPDQTLGVIQSLYEKKLCTYPRTDSRVLSSAVGKVISENIQGLYDGNYLRDFTGEILNSRLYANINDTQYINDKKVSDHYAIIPTGNLSNYSSLSDIENDVFDLIVRRFLCIFYPAAVYKNVKASIKIKNETFYANSKELISEGYLKIIRNDDETDNATKSRIPELSIGSAISVNDLTVKEGKTSPPKRYTTGSMILAMENAGQLIEDEELREQIKGSGIGTSATRADILKKLITNKYIDCNKSQVLTPNSIGEMVYEIVYNTIPDFLVPELTARWDKELEMIANGELRALDYQNKIEVYVRDTVNSIKTDNKNDVIISKIKPFVSNTVATNENLKCPVCGGRIKKTQFGYCCENYKKEGGCNFALPGKICEKTLTDKQVTDLVIKRKTGLIKGFKSKNGKSFDAFLIFKDNKVQFEFPAPEESKVLCPNCGNKLIKNKYSYDCSCGFKISHVICGKEISEKDIKELLTQKRTGLIKGLKAKSGKNFDAYLLYEDGKIKFELGMKDLNEFSQIVTICDVFEAYTSRRIYHPHRSLKEGFDYLLYLSCNKKVNDKFAKAFIDNMI